MQCYWHPNVYPFWSYVRLNYLWFFQFNFCGFPYFFFLHFVRYILKPTILFTFFAFSFLMKLISFLDRRFSLFLSTVLIWVFKVVCYFSCAEIKTLNFWISIIQKLLIIFKWAFATLCIIMILVIYFAFLNLNLGKKLQEWLYLNSTLNLNFSLHNFFW